MGWYKHQEVSNGRFIFRTYVDHNQNQEGNFSNCRVKSTLQGIGGATAHNQNGEAGINANGQNWGGHWAYNIGASEQTVKETGWFVVYHNNEGNGSFNYHAYYRAKNSWLKDQDIWGDIYLPQINRITYATNFNDWNNFIVSDEMVVKLHRFNNNFKHNIALNFGAWQGDFYEVSRQEVDTETKIKLTPEELAILYGKMNSSTIPTAIWVGTYNNGNFIGERTYRFTARLSPDIKAKIIGETIVESKDEIIAFGIDRFVKDNSLIKVKFFQEAGIGTGSIKTSVVKYNGRVFNSDVGSDGSREVIFTPDKAGDSQEVVIEILDSHGLTDRKVLTINVMDYKAPYLIDYRAYRSSDNGENEAFSQKVMVVGKIIRTELPNNNITVQIFSKKQEEVDFELKTTKVYSTNLNVKELVNDFEEDDQYLIKIKLTDNLGGTSEYEIIIPVSEVTIHLGTNKIGIGKVNEKEDFSVDVKGQVYQRDGKRVLDEDDVISSDINFFCIGSQRLIASSKEGEGNQNIKMLGAYAYSLIRGVFNKMTIPEGYHREYRLTFQGNTQTEGKVWMKLNNIETEKLSTWSSIPFRIIGSSPMFKEEDIILEPTKDFEFNGTLGINLYLMFNSGIHNARWFIDNPTIHGYIVKD